MVRTDLCETLTDLAPSARVDWAETLELGAVAQPAHDAALIEASRNADIVAMGVDTVLRAHRYLIWITDMMTPVPADVPGHGTLFQPFRTGDVTSVLSAVGLLSPMR